MQKFRASSPKGLAGWDNLDYLHFRVHLPWVMLPPPLSILFLVPQHLNHSPRPIVATSTHKHLLMDLSKTVGCGATPIFDDAAGSFGTVNLTQPLGPLQSSTDVEVAGILLALRHLSSHTDWTHASIVCDSQAALHQFRGISWHHSLSSTLFVYEILM